MITITARDFNRDVSAAKRAANDGPVTITDRGQPAYVLLTAEDYDRLADKRSIADMLYDPLAAEIEIEFEPLGPITRDIEL